MDKLLNKVVEVIVSIFKANIEVPKVEKTPKLAEFHQFLQTEFAQEGYALGFHNKIPAGVQELWMQMIFVL